MRNLLHITLYQEYQIKTNLFQKSTQTYNNLINLKKNKI